MIRPAEPACAVLPLVLHFFDFEHAREIASAFVRWLSGSYAIISVGSGGEQIRGALTRAYIAAPVYSHSPGQVAADGDTFNLKIVYQQVIQQDIGG